MTATVRVLLLVAQIAAIAAGIWLGVVIFNAAS
jgi:hypothetical protein